MHTNPLLFAVFCAGLLSAALCDGQCQIAKYRYTRINGYLCIRSEFVKTFNSIRSDAQCSELCSREQHCQAFTTTDGPCQLFVFHKCSKSVRDCSCSRTGQVFVKKQPGLEPGSLCPSGYIDDLCGVKYKLHSGISSWPEGRTKCESESGLVIMMDVIDATELDHMETLYSTRSSGKTFWVGGFQEPGSPEPAGGWYWVGCNITLDLSFFHSGEPSNSSPKQDWAARWHGRTHLSDHWETDSSQGVFCECVSPFN